MDLSGYREVSPGGKPIKRAYIAIMLWFVGRAIQAASRVDKAVKREFDDLPEGFAFRLGVMPSGPYMVVGKEPGGRVKYLGGDAGDRAIDLDMKIKNLEAAVLMFTFQEATAQATCRNRLIVDGEVPPACGIVRVLDMVEIFLLPKLVARLAVKRYPKWSLIRKFVGRTRIYMRAVLGY
jgi:aldehyde:ferredoxin oxidoreductase